MALNAEKHLKYSNMDIVNLNVGGESFKSFYQTLARSNYFKQLLNDESMPCKTSANGDEEIFVDRNDDLFQGILSFLRTDLVLSEEPEKLQSLRNEALFYQVDKMVEAIDSKLKRQAEEMSQVQILVKDVIFLGGASASQTNYLVKEIGSNIFRVYQIVGVINAYMEQFSDPYRTPFPRILLHPTKKKVYQFTQA